MGKDFERREFDGHVQVDIRPDEVRLWVCDSKGQCVFRLKARGKVHKGVQDIMVMQNGY